ncbi:MAG: DUF1176 domain-containing protein [Pseudomonadota bacterium]|nr:DUF1176 domain-containing protein [Pseudomonadota bacterium]
MRPFHLVLPAAAFLSCLSGTKALTQDMPYLDDRSSAATIVKSLYNAVNRKEYARAWDYFGDQKPAEDVEAFAKGYESTAQVELITGEVASEGAAGSVYYHVPVAIRSSSTDGNEQVFAGCYVARLANPAIQEPPFRPLHIEKGSLKASDLAYEEAVPESCPDAPAAEATDTILAQAKTAFLVSHPACDPHSPGSDQPEVSEYGITFRNASDMDDQPERQARLFRFYCGAGAYNETHVYYLYDEANGLRALQFTVPELDIRYENDDFEGKVEDVSIIGYLAEDVLVNSSYDEAEHSIISYNKWRGIGDAGTTGTWIFRNGEFTLVKYDVDASYDGEVNPEPVLDFHTAP